MWPCDETFKIDLRRPIPEGRNERHRTCSFDAKPEAGVIGRIGLGLMLLKADQTDRYVVGSGQRVSLDKLVARV